MPAPFVEDASFVPCIILASLPKKSGVHRCGGLQFDSIGQPVCFYANANQFSLLQLYNRVWCHGLWCLQKLLYCTGLFWLPWVLFFHMKLIIFLSKSVKNYVEIALNLKVAFGRIVIFIVWILPIQEHGRSFHFLEFSSISFFKELMSNRSFTSLVSVASRYFTLFVTIVKGDVSLISFSAYQLYMGGLVLFFFFVLFL